MAKAKSFFTRARKVQTADRHVLELHARGVRFVKIWVELWVSGPGSVAGAAIVLGEFVSRLPGAPAAVSPAAWGTAAIAGFGLARIPSWLLARYVTTSNARATSS